MILTLDTAANLMRDLPAARIVTKNLFVPSAVPGHHGYLLDLKRPLYHPVQYRVGQVFRPRRTCHIGVLYGFGVAALWRGVLATGREPERVLLVDSGLYDPTSPRYAWENVARVVSEKVMVQYEGDSREADPAMREYGPFDLVEVDGGHERDVALHDLRLAWRHLAPGGIILADDCRNRQVADALHLFARETDQAIVCIPSAHGYALFQRPA